jgi:hypothetical protein
MSEPRNGRNPGSLDYAAYFTNLSIKGDRVGEDKLTSHPPLWTR